MSTTTVQAVFKDRDSGAFFDPTSVKLSDPTDTYGVKRNDTDAMVVADATAMTKNSTGHYSYSFTDPAPDLTYTAYIEYVISSETYRDPMTVYGYTTPSSYGLLTYATIYAGVGSQFGADTLTAGQITQAKKYANDGYTDALMATYPGPDGLPVSYTWSFLNEKHSLSATSGTTSTDCPSTFMRPNGPIYFDNDEPYAGAVTQVSVQEIMDRRSGVTSDSGRPFYFAINRKAHTAAGGTTWEILWDVELDQAYTFVWEYDPLTATLSGDTDLPIGPPWFHQLVMAAGKARAEQRHGDTLGPMTAEYNDRLQKAIAYDSKGKASNIGRLDGRIFRSGHGRWTGTVTPSS